MKNSAKICIVAAVAVVSLCGCQGFAERNYKELHDNMTSSFSTEVRDKQQNDDSQARPDIEDAGLVITTNSDYNELASTLEELYSGADLVC